MFGAVNSAEMSARYQPRKRSSISERMSRIPKSVDLGLLWGSYTLIIGSQFLLDARRMKFDARVPSDMPLLGEIMWKKAIECVTRPDFLPQISELPPLLVALLTVSSFALFSLNAMRVIAVKSTQCSHGAHKMAVSTLLTLVGGILMTSDAVDYLILIVPLAVAVGITAALGSTAPPGKKEKDDGYAKLDSGYESDDLEDRWVGKKVDYNSF